MQFLIMRVLNALAFMPSVLAAALSPIPIDSRSLSDIYAAAQNESGILRVVHGGDEQNQADALFDAFSAKFPNINVNHSVDLSKYLDGRINQAFQQNELYADLAILQTQHDYDAWEDEGLLLHYKPPSFDKLWPSLTNANGAYLPVFAASFGPFVFNASVVPTADIPKSYGDILNPKWKGKIVLTYPNDDDAVLYLFKLIIQQYGWEWLDQLLEQDVQWVRGTDTPSAIMLRDENKTISFTTYPPAEGWISVSPVSDRYMSWTQTSAIFKDTKLPETAKLLQAYLISEEFQLTRGVPSVRKDIGNSTIWDSKTTDYVTFHQFMEDRESVEQLRFVFEDKIGTAQGLSPLIDNIF
ncbi:putative abc-type fe3+ transport periplasmic component protein [Penicillium brasilianum]|uniref:Putative abc-type fe3+ transport periplasmic component protein n=1 Tax=Penicillium brasilianum TaxID=104259 RepID=A0A1S9RS44_PENBI|nr:putative abc-type fe3+ transport periplasmic component protein [Penicillium brasilianum]